MSAPPLPRPWNAIDERVPSPKVMVILIGANVGPRGDYTTDPYCGWRNADDSWARWPHPFPPTHWAPIPATS